MLEEGPGGLYETCDELAGSEAAQLLAKLQAAPEVTVLPHSDSPTVLNGVRRALERAGYDFREDKARETARSVFGRAESGIFYISHRLVSAGRSHPVPQD